MGISECSRYSSGSRSMASDAFSVRSTRSAMLNSFSPAPRASPSNIRDFSDVKSAANPRRAGD